MQSTKEADKRAELKRKMNVAKLAMREMVI